MSAAALVEHEAFCLPRPGLDEPRMERFVQDREANDGQVVARVLTDRCIECGATSYLEV